MWLGFHFRRRFQLLVSASIVAVGLYSFMSRSWGMNRTGGDAREEKAEATTFKPDSGRPEMKKILFWYEGPRRRPDDLRSAGCPVWQCEFANDRTLAPAESYDAVVFHQRSWSLKDLPSRRSPSQRYVFLTMESPAWRMTNMSEMAGFFNWTMTYRSDSDVVNPYGWFSASTDDSSSTESVKCAGNKTKLAAWFVSNCHSVSGRNELVRLLQQYVSVDIYGRCGPFKCPRSKREDCQLLLECDYKFYLSLENSLCVDYITEKFFDQLRYNVVPVVFDLHGRHDKVAPPHSFINAADFPSVRLLADYLLQLDKDDNLYNKYFDWKEHYVMHGAEGGMCRLCARLHESDSTAIKIYPDMTEWWETRAQCKTVNFRNIRNPSGENDSYWQPVSYVTT